MIILRLSDKIDEDYCNRLIGQIKKYNGCCDEVWLPTLYGYPSVETHRNYAIKLKKYASLFKNAGIKVSLQLSNTIGHGEYIASRDCSGLVFDGSPVQTIVDFSGVKSQHSFCWNNDFFKKYISESLCAYADIYPDNIWIDDDCRILGHNPIEMGCFCDHCLSLFNQENGTSYDRDELQNKLLYHDLDLQDKFLKFIADKVEDFYFDVLSDFHKFSPDTEFGVENGDLESEILCGNYMFRALKRLNGKSPKVRPGYGCYNDHNPNDIFLKTTRIEWLNFRTPKEISYRISENEDTPSVAYGKSVMGNCLESSLYLAVGTNHLSFTNFQRQYEDFSYSRQNLKEFSRLRPLWQKIIDNNNYTVLGGASYVCSSALYRQLSKEGQGIAEFHKYVFTPLFNIYRLGIPFNIGIDENKVNFLSGVSAKTLSKEEIERLLDCNVICDGEALEYLINKGFNFGVKANRLSGFQTNRVFEKVQSHPVNNFAYDRWGRSFCDGVDYSVSAEQNAYFEVISTYSTTATDCNDFVNEDIVANAVIKSPKGKKWIALGYYPWNPTVSFDKRNQILSSIEYLKPQSLSLKLLSPTQTYVIAKEKNYKLSSFYATNCSLGDQTDLEFTVNVKPKKISAYTVSGKGVNATFSGNKIVIDRLAPFDMVCVFMEKL